MAETKAKAVPETITLLDGRTRDFTEKKRLHKASETLPDGRMQVRLDFRNGETRLFTLRPDMVAQFALHGAEQKLGDEISNVDSIDDAVEAIDQLMQRLDAGDWTKEREGGSGLAGACVLTKAMVVVTGSTVEQVRAYLATMDNKVKVALRNSAELSPTIKQIEAEIAARRAAAGKGAPAIDVAAVLAGVKLPPAPASALPTA